jgi:ATP-dependent Lon protease
MTLSAFVALCSGLLAKPVQSQLVVLGSMSLGGSIIPVQNLAETLQVAFDSGAKRILLPMASVRDIPSVPGELFAKFQTSFYADPKDAVFKALGVEKRASISNAAQIDWLSFPGEQQKFGGIFG